MIRIAIDGRALQQGYKDHRQRGVGTFVRSLLGALAARPAGLDYTLLLDARYGDPGEEYAGMGREHAVAPRPRLPVHPTLQSAFLLGPSLARVPGDLFFFPFHEDAPIRSGRRPRVVMVHDCIPFRCAALYGYGRLALAARRRLGSRILAGATVVTASAASRDDIVTIYGIQPEKVHVIGEATDRSFRRAGVASVEELRGRLGLAHPYLLALGGGDPRKNNARVIGVWGEALASGEIDHDLVVAGPPGRREWEGRLATAARDSGAAARLHRLPYLELPDLVSLYSGATALLFLSHCEGFGLPVLEAMSCGVPVVASSVSAVPETAGDAALSVDPDDRDGIRRAVARVASDAALREEMIEKGLRHAASFSWADVADRLTGIFRDTIDGWNGRSER